MSEQVDWWACATTAGRCNKDLKQYSKSCLKKLDANVQVALLQIDMLRVKMQVFIASHDTQQHWCLFEEYKKVPERFYLGIMQSGRLCAGIPIGLRPLSRGPLSPWLHNSILFGLNLPPSLNSKCAMMSAYMIRMMLMTLAFIAQYSKVLC